MSKEDRKAYQQAITCLMRTPTRNKDQDSRLSAWDDYGVLHYYQTPYVHNSATFLLWHRHYNWVLEQDMMKTCGYKGVQSQFFFNPFTSLTLSILSPIKVISCWIYA
jgi:tyrosinase